jgi:hypothetical protein
VALPEIWSRLTSSLNIIGVSLYCSDASFVAIADKVLLISLFIGSPDRYQIDDSNEFLSSSANHQFPAQALTVSATGELKRSYLASSIDETFSEAIFEVACE